MAVGPATIVRPAPAEGRPVTLRGLLEREGVFSWLMLTPGVLFLLAFVAYPFFYGIFLSLEDRRVASVVCVESQRGRDLHFGRNSSGVAARRQVRVPRSLR